MRRVVVPVLRAGLSLTSQILERYGLSVSDVYPVLPRGGKVEFLETLPEADEYIVVDANVCTGTTILRVAEAIRERFPRARLTLAGNPKTDIAERILDIHLKPPELSGYMIVVSGLPGCGKSLIAHCVARALGCVRLKWAKYLPSDPGRYGERYEELRHSDPFILSKEFVRRSGIMSLRDRFVVIDGIKNYLDLIFVAFITRRPVFLVWVEAPEELRRHIVRCRGDADDRFDEERVRLLWPQLRELRDRAFCRVRMVNFEGFEKLASVLGLRTVRISKYLTPFPSKSVILDVMLHELERGRVYSPCVEVETSGSYARKVLRLNPRANQRVLEHVETIRRGFKVLDDIIDEDEVRDYKPSLWVRIGIFPAMLTGIAYVTLAREQARRLGLEGEFMSMIWGVCRAVKLEIEYEERRLPPRSLDDWLIAAEREALFREYVAVVSGRRDARYVMYLDGLRAQMLDDVLGLNKEGRRGKELLLNRPLIQRFVKIDEETARKVSDELKSVIERELRSPTISSREEARHVFLEVLHSHI